MDILFELANGLGGEGVRDSFALARMFGTVPRVKKATLDRDEGVVVFTGQRGVSLLTSRFGRRAYDLRNPVP